MHKIDIIKTIRKPHPEVVSKLKDTRIREWSHI